jgi:IclR family acetate operon transcriptional repressor
LALPKSIARGFVADSGSRLTRRYRLGLTLAKLGNAAEIQSPLISVAMPLMQAVTDVTGLTTPWWCPTAPTP